MYTYWYMYNVNQWGVLHFRRYQLDSWCAVVQLNMQQQLLCNYCKYSSVAELEFVQYLYSKCAVLLCSWTCSGSFCVITVSTDQLQTVQFVQYLYSKCVVLLCSWKCISSFCVITVSTVLYSLYSTCTANVRYNKTLNMTGTVSFVSSSR
jgi:hypothetical protein